MNPSLPTKEKDIHATDPNNHNALGFILGWKLHTVFVYIPIAFCHKMFNTIKKEP